MSAYIDEQQAAYSTGETAVAPDRLLEANQQLAQRVSDQRRIIAHQRAQLEELREKLAASNETIREVINNLKG